MVVAEGLDVRVMFWRLRPAQKTDAREVHKQKRIMLPLEKSEELCGIDKQQFEGWQDEWGGRVWRFERQSSADTSITRMKSARAQMLAQC